MSIHKFTLKYLMASNKNLNKDTPPTSWKWKKKIYKAPGSKRKPIQTFGFL